jgi:hypothetical protein
MPGPLLLVYFKLPPFHQCSCNVKYILRVAQLAQLKVLSSQMDQAKTEPVPLNVYGAPELIPRN